METYSVENVNKELKKFDTNSKYYGQWETDKIIESYFVEGYRGICIDVGAADGIKGSNTMYFEKCGWGVLCIEPNLEHVNSLTKHRKLNRYFACGDKNNDELLYVFNVGKKNITSSITSLKPDKRLVDDHEHLINSTYKVSVPVRTLSWILEHEVMGTIFDKVTKIDFISIDTEGTELDVLKGFDFDKYRVSLFVVENNYNDPDIENFMNGVGYKKDKRYKINDFYIKEK